MEDVGIFMAIWFMLVFTAIWYLYIMTIWFILWSFGIFFPVSPRKIWQSQFVTYDHSYGLNQT
jgi:hypothetical protein